MVIGDDMGIVWEMEGPWKMARPLHEGFLKFWQLRVVTNCPHRGPRYEDQILTFICDSITVGKNEIRHIEIDQFKATFIRNLVY